MSLIADIMLLFAAIAAAFYCRTLANRLRRFGQTDQGLGGAITALSFQVEEMKAALNSVSSTTDSRSRALTELTIKADTASRRLELLMASLHEVEEPDSRPDIGRPVLKLSAQDRVTRSRDKTSSQRQISRLLMRQRRAEKPEYAK